MTTLDNLTIEEIIREYRDDAEKAFKMLKEGKGSPFELLDKETRYLAALEIKKKL